MEVVSFQFISIKRYKFNFEYRKVNRIMKNIASKKLKRTLINLCLITFLKILWIDILKYFIMSNLKMIRDRSKGA